MADFLSLGEMLIDFTPAGRTPAGIPLFEQNPGGAPANVAVQAARLGVSAGFIVKVGRDMFGAFLQQTLEQNGVETANLRFSAETATSLAFVQLSERGDRDFSFYRDPGADTQLRFEEVDKTQLDGAKVLCTIFRLYKDYKPFAFFGAAALIFLIAALLLFLPVGIEYLRTGLVPRFPTLIVSVTLGLCALLSFVAGVILDVVVKKHRQLFELMLTLMEEGSCRAGQADQKVDR